MAKTIRYDICKYLPNEQLWDFEYPDNYQEGIKMAKELSKDPKWGMIVLMKWVHDDNAFFTDAQDRIEWEKVYIKGKFTRTINY